QQGRCGFADEHGQLTPLRPGDIAILVRDRHDAAAMRAALHARGLAHVYLSDNQSVYASAEATELLAWLAACAEPGNDRAMRAALATPCMGQSLAELDRLNTDEAHWEACGEHFRQLHALWQRHGVLAMLHELLHRFSVPARLLARADGERALTNLLHMAELLQQAASGLESEAALIKIVTIHKSKGLEYPVVLLPFVCGFRETSDKKPLLWHDAHGAAHFDLRPDTEAWKHAEAERLQEDLRLLYVALTRARHLCWLGVACLKNGNGKASELHKSAFGYVLAGGQPIEPAELRARVDQLAQGQGAIHVAELPEQADTQRYRPQDHAIQPREARRCTLPPHTPWWIASYSALAQHDEATPNPAPETPAQTPLAEATQADDTAEAAPAAQGIHAFPRGAAPGT